MTLVGKRRDLVLAAKEQSSPSDSCCASASNVECGVPGRYDCVDISNSKLNGFHSAANVHLHLPGSKLRTLPFSFLAMLVRPACKASLRSLVNRLPRVCLIGIGLALALPVTAQRLLPTETVNGTAAGRSSGVARVGSFGEANYVMPLWVAPGRAGVQPALGLAYSSTVGNGLLGVGWALTGLSKITRCPRTWLQEGEAKAVRFVDGDGGDRYCLDGQRLVLVGGANGIKSRYGEHESEYRTERDTQIKVVAFQTNAQGPRFFRAYLKDGKILTFGATADARLEGRVANSRLGGTSGYPPRYTVETTYDQSVVAAWALSRIEDRSGNFLTIRYGLEEIAHGYEQFPLEIAYTGHGGAQPLAPTRLVQFTYGSRPDTSEQFSGGLRTLVTRRLTQIQVQERSSNRTELLRDYRLVYRTSTLSRRSLLTQVTECDGQGVCLKPTTFQWSEPTPNLQMQDLGAFSASGNASAPNSQAIIHTGDINGDGLDDALLRESQGQTWQLRLSNTSALGAAQPGPPSEPRDPNAGTQAREAEGRLVDLDADGHADFMVRERPRSGGGVSPPELFRSQIYRATDTGFQQFADPLETYTRVYRESYVLDLDGDGLPDLAKPMGEAGTPGGLRWAARRNLGSTFDVFKTSDVSYRAPGPLTFWPVEALAIDLDGRGAQDLVIEFSDHGATALRWDGGEFKKIVVPTLLTKCRPLFADVNGDGLIDQIDLDSSQRVIHVAINTGRGFLAPADWSVPAPYDNSPALQNPGGCTTDYDAGVRVVDFNGDGKDDLLLLGGYVNGGVRRLAVLESTGAGFAPRDLAIQVQSNAPTPNGWRTAQTLDVNGDGLPDFVTATGGKLLLYTRQSLPNDYLQTATDGLGRYDHFAYGPFVKLHDQGAGGVCRYPLGCTRRGPWLVAEHTADSGTKPGRRYTYRYHDARHDLAGRGWLGFGRVDSRDQQTSQQVQESFDNTTRVETFYPCAGFSVVRSSAVPIQEDKTSARIHRTTVTRQCQPVLSGQGSSRNFFSYASRTRLVEEELPMVGGPAVVATKLREVDLRETHDAFDNVTLAEQQTYPVDSYGALGRATVWRRSTRYDNHVGSWLIGRPAHVEITQAARSGRSVVTVVNAQFDDRTGLLTELDEAGQSGDSDPVRAAAVVTNIERNDFGLPVRLVQRDGPELRTVKLEYDGEQMFVSSLVNPEGHRVFATYHSGLGLPLRQADVNGFETQLSYDGFGRLRIKRQPQGREVRLSYGMTTSGEFRLTESPRGGVSVAVIHDRLGRARRLEWQDAARQLIGIDYQFDIVGRLIGQTRPYGTSTSPVWERTSYDALSRPLEVVHPDGTKTTLKYEGLKLSRKDEEKHERYLVSDELGRVAESAYVTDNGRVIRSRFAYGPRNQLEQVINPDADRVAQSFDVLGFRTAIDDPDLGAMRFATNKFGDVTQVKLASGLELNHVPDRLGRVTETTTPQGQLTFQWDNASRGVGSLSQSENNIDQVKTDYSFDALGRPEQTTWTIDGVGYSLRTEYDNLGRPSTIHYPVPNGAAPAFAVRNHYTAEGRLERVTDLAGQVVYWQVLQRDAQERVTAERLGNGIVTRRSYGSNDMLRTVQSGPQGQATVQNLEYAYYQNRNLYRRLDHLTSSMEEFVYDKLDRLIAWDIYQPGVRVSTGYGYDDVGNVLTRTQPLGPDPSRQYKYGEAGAGSHAVTSVISGGITDTYGYDRGGNLVSMPQATLAYNGLNQPAEIQRSNAPKVTFKYDAAGQRVLKQIAASQKFITLGRWYERRIDTSGDVQLYSIHADGRIVAQAVWTGANNTWQIYYLLPDSLGSTDVVTNSSGAAVEYLKYAPFGERLQRRHLGKPGPSSVSPVRLGFTGHLHDDELGLIHTGQRLYSPQLMRFLAPDPFVKHRFDSQAFNRYTYARNNPLAFVDPDGLNPVPVSSPPAQTVTFTEPSVIRGEIYTTQPVSSPATSPVTVPAPAAAAVTNTSEPSGAPAISYTGGFGVSRNVGDDQGARSVPTQAAVPMVPVGPHSGPAAPPISPGSIPNFTPWPGNRPNVPTVQAPKFPALGGSVGGGAMMCFGLCLGVVDIHVGVYVTHTPPGGDERESVAFFLSLGGGSIWTLAPPPIQSPDPGTGWGEGQVPPPLTLGLGMGAGVDGQLFVSEAPTFDDFSGYAYNVSGGVGSVVGGVSENPNNQKTISIGGGVSKGWPAGIAGYGTQTWGVTFPGK